MPGARTDVPIPFAPGELSPAPSYRAGPQPWHSCVVHTVGLTWRHAFEAGAVLAVVGAAMATAKDRRIRAAGAFVREAAVIGALYGLWQLAGEISVTGWQGAFGRARWIERFERAVHLPSEHGVQHLFLGHHALVNLANLYYASMHLSMMFVFLFWLFARHRDEYRPVRQVLAWTTLGCLLVQLLPVAPPRMLPGIVDTALLYGQSVYSNGLPIDQLSAMPSLHVGWAVLVGYYTWRISPSRWRYIGPLHAVLTILFVVVTGNHWWLDGIVAIAILCVAAWSVYGVRRLWRAMTERRRRRPAGDPEDADGRLVPDLQMREAT